MISFNQLIKLVIATGALIALVACSDEFIDQPALGALSEKVVATESGVQKLLIGAYAALDAQEDRNGWATTIGGNGNAWEASPDNWIYGAVVGGTASKGSHGGDQPAIDQIAKFIATPSNGFFNTKWKAAYEGVSRTNSVLKIIEQVDDISESSKQNIIGQARFLRGHYYFELKKMFNNVPWIDETTEDPNQPNDVDIWPMIESDFKYAFENLPETQSEFGRANKWAAGAYLAKAYLYQQKHAEAQSLFTNVIENGVNSAGEPYALVEHFSDNFDAATENNSETVFDIQMVANDGTNTIANSNQGQMLNFPYNSPFRCCGFFQPTQDLVNSYRTSNNGLPYLDSFNDHPVKNDMGINSDESFSPDKGPLDPRLDWTVGRRGVPFHDWGYHPGMAWIRDQVYGGPYAPKKNIYWQATQDQYSDQSMWAPGTAINIHIIRFADVLLMAAEAEVHAGSLEKAREYVNKVRKRAQNEDSFLYDYIDEDDPMAGFDMNDPAANYNISTYPTSQFSSKEDALKAIYFERKLELAMEGHRFFDLVRWGIAEQELNRYFDYQGNITTDVRGASFTSGKSEYFPIPQAQIDLSVGKDGNPVLQQNPGY